MSLFTRLVEFYKHIEWPMVQVPNETVLSTTYQGRNGQWVFVVSANDPQANVAMFSRVPQTCPPERLDAIAAFFTRINFGLLIGAWVIDTSDGEMRFRVGQDAKAIDLSIEVLQRLTLYTVMTMDHYLPAIEAVLKGEATTQQAYEIVFPPAH